MRTALMLASLVALSARTTGLVLRNISAPRSGTYVVPILKFENGETLRDLRLHYATFGTRQTDRAGRTTNAVLVVHGTGGSGKQFSQPKFGGVLFAAGGFPDAPKHFIVIPDGHRKWTV